MLAEAGASSAELDELALQAWTRFFQGLAEMLSGAIQAGREQLEASRKLHHELGIAIGEGRSISVLGGTYVMAGDTARGKELLEAALSIYTAADDRWGQGQCHTFLGIIAEDTTADRSVATTHYREAVDLLRRSRDATLLPVALIGQAGIVAERDAAKAIKLIGAASAIRARVGGEFAPFYRKRLDHVRAVAERSLGAATDRFWTEGAGLAFDEAVALAFGTDRARQPPPSAAGLSARELEVAALVAEGLSNNAIAARLHLSVRTIESHVRHALAKVGLDNRTQLATWARERIQ